MNVADLQEQWQQAELAITRWTEANPNPDTEALAEYARLSRVARSALAAYEAARRQHK